MFQWFLLTNDNLSTFKVNIEIPHALVDDNEEYNLLITYFDTDRNAEYILDVVYIGWGTKNVLKSKLDGKEIITVRIPNEFKQKHKQGKLHYMLLKI